MSFCQDCRPKVSVLSGQQKAFEDNSVPSSIGKDKGVGDVELGSLPGDRGMVACYLLFETGHIYGMICVGAKMLAGCLST
jgi:hypothetical protein